MADKDKLRNEYDVGDLGKGKRGKYYEEYSRDANVVVLDPDVARAFPDSQSVNRALRKYLLDQQDDRSEKNK